MPSHYLELAKQELERLNEEIEPFRQALNRLIETRDAWATIIRNTSPEPVRTMPVEQAEPNTRPMHQQYTEERSENVSQPAPPSQSARPEERGENYGWKINDAREMFRSTYPRP